MKKYILVISTISTISIIFPLIGGSQLDPALQRLDKLKKSLATELQMLSSEIDEHVLHTKKTTPDEEVRVYLNTIAERLQDLQGLIVGSGAHITVLKDSVDTPSFQELTEETFEEQPTLTDYLAPSILCK